MRNKQIWYQIEKIEQFSQKLKEQGKFEQSLPCYKKILSLLKEELLTASKKCQKDQIISHMNITTMNLNQTLQKLAQPQKQGFTKKQAYLKKQAQDNLAKKIQRFQYLSKNQDMQQKKPIGSVQKKEDFLLKQQKTPIKLRPSTSNRKQFQKLENRSISTKVNSSEKLVIKNPCKETIQKTIPKSPIMKPPLSPRPQNNRTTMNKFQYSKKKPIDPAIEEMIIKDKTLTFKQIVGMKQAKSAVQQSVIWPRLKPELYQGIRAPPKGILLYGPPGNGKSYIAKALASQCKCTFFSVSAATIMGKWVGDSERKLKLLFDTAIDLKPSIIFIDEIDSLLTARSQKQNEVSRRVKTQFLVHMEGISSAKQGDVLLIGATNLPSQLDKAVLSRFNQLIYIGMPDPQVRQGIVLQKLKDIKYQLSQNDLKTLSQMLQGYSARQIKNICKQVSMLPLTQLSMSAFKSATNQTIRKIVLNDFQKILSKKKKVLSAQDLKKYAGKFGED